MRLIVFSDSHGQLEFAFRALKEAGKLDLILHAGDYYRDGLRLSAETVLPVKAVLGNCDRFEKGPLEVLLDLAGYRILMTHGHIGAYEQMHDRFLALAAESGANAVVFGHTHAAEIRREAGVLFFNPGSIARPRDQEEPSYGILDIGEDGIKPIIYRVP